MPKNIELYNKSVDTLFQAYFKNELQHGECDMCAVGNLCKDAANQLGLYTGAWGNVFVTVGGVQHMLYGFDTTEGYRVIEASGYTLKELMQIEFAFELTRHQSDNQEENMYTGLVAVLDVLRQIHEIEDEPAADQKQRFTSHYHSLQKV